MKRVIVLYLAGYVYFEVAKGHKAIVASNVPYKVRACAVAQPLSHSSARVTVSRAFGCL
jgi:hypothetical protein